jgi:hypothetical protein
MYIKTAGFCTLSETACVLITKHHTRSNKICLSDTGTQAVTLIHYWQAQQSAIKPVTAAWITQCPTCPGTHTIEASNARQPDYQLHAHTEHPATHMSLHNILVFHTYREMKVTLTLALKWKIYPT